MHGETNKDHQGFTDATLWNACWIDQNAVHSVDVIWLLQKAIIHTFTADFYNSLRKDLKYIPSVYSNFYVFLYFLFLRIHSAAIQCRFAGFGVIYVH